MIQYFYIIERISWTIKLLISLLHGVTMKILLNLLTPNVNYSGRTAPLTSKVAFYIFIQQI